MKLKSWIVLGIIFLGSCSVWANYIFSRRIFLNDFNGGVHAYLSGDFSLAESSLRKALVRRPRDAKVKQLLIKVLIERSFSQYHQKDFSGALDTLARATATAPKDQETLRALEALRAQLGVPQSQRPVNMDQVLDGLYRHLPEKSQPQSIQSLLELYLHRSQMSQEEALKRYSANQESWLVQVQHEKDSFRKILYGGLALFSVAGVTLVAFFLWVLQSYLGRRGVFARLLEDHYQRIVTALPAGSQVMLGPPMSLHSIPEAQHMDIIEAQIVSGQDPDTSVRRLQPLLGKENPWIRARAAKILYQLDAQTALSELGALVEDASADAKVAALWALGEIGSVDALTLLTPLAYSPIREIQQGTIRSLLQLQSRERLPADVRQKLSQLLPEIRSKTGWVF
jgi:hypothetical protein